jgi:hypothetical protein
LELFQVIIPSELGFFQVTEDKCKEAGRNAALAAMAATTTGIAAPDVDMKP